MERSDNRDKRMSGEDELELYFHIPFCAKKCIYCDFPSAPADMGTRDRYLEALLAETRGRAEAYRQYMVSSVFIGGGTPSLLKGGQIIRLMEEVIKHYRLAKGAEITLEMNPGTVDREKLAAYRLAGINRLSIGLQSADNGELVFLGRIHSYEDFLETYRAAREAGFDNLNVDVMGALPGQSLESYLSTLRKVLVLEPEHISAYSLILEEGTPLWEMAQEGLVQAVEEEIDRDMYQETRRLLQEAGYHRYEISNYAREGYACKHNLGYWQRKNYLGFGMAAASLVENTRFRNCSRLDTYLKDPLGCREECHVLTDKEQMEEFFFLGLRMTAGVDLGAFERIFGRSAEEIYGDVIRKNVQDGLLRRYFPGQCGEGRKTWEKQDSHGQSRVQGPGGDRARSYVAHGSQGPGGDCARSCVAHGSQGPGGDRGRSCGMHGSQGPGEGHARNCGVHGSQGPGEDRGRSCGTHGSQGPGEDRARSCGAHGSQEPGGDHDTSCTREWLALTERGLDLSNYVSAQFLLT